MEYNSSRNREEHAHPYVGMWVTKDGYIRHELLSNGRYDEARGQRKVRIKDVMSWKEIILNMWMIRVLQRMETL